MTEPTTYYTKREGRSMADLGVLPNNTDVWMVDEMVAAYVPVEPDYECSKCGGTNINLKYAKYGGNTLHCLCVRCSHEWAEAPKDAGVGGETP